jgi:hypothetical protein
MNILMTKEKSKMEPLIIFIDGKKDDYIKIKADEFERYIKEAYELGIGGE